MPMHGYKSPKSVSGKAGMRYGKVTGGSGGASPTGDFKHTAVGGMVGGYSGKASFSPNASVREQRAEVEERRTALASWAVSIARTRLCIIRPAAASGGTARAPWALLGERAREGRVVAPRALQELRAPPSHAKHGLRGIRGTEERQLIHRVRV